MLLLQVKCGLAYSGCRGDLLFYSEGLVIYQRTEKETCFFSQSRVTFRRSIVSRSRLSLPVEMGDGDNLTDIEQSILNFIRSHYKQSDIRVIANEGSYLQINIGRLKNEVIQGNNFWERIQISFIYFEQDADFVKLHMILDGQYSAGLRYPRQLQAYSDMEPDYFAQLQCYTDEMLLKLKDHLAGRESHD